MCEDAAKVLKIDTLRDANYEQVFFTIASLN